MANRPPTYSFEPKKSTPTTWRQLGCLVRGKSDAERGRIGAELVTGQIPLPLPSPGVAAKLCKTTPYWVQVALNGGNAHGRNGSGNGSHSLAEHMLTSTPAELFEAARAVGVDQVWDLMIMPVMQATDRQSKAAK
jgi:hypothetical protein